METKSALTLTRRAGQSIQIGDAEITILKVGRGGNVQIRIVADRTLPILRAELKNKGVA